MKLQRKIRAVKKATWIPGPTFDHIDRKKDKDRGDKCYILLIPTTEDVNSDGCLLCHLRLNDYGKAS